MVAIANDVPPELGFSWVVFLTLVTVTCISAAVFVWQVRRWTTHPGWRALLDWSRERGFALSRPEKPAGEPFDRLAGARVTTLLESTGGKTRAMQLAVTPGGGAETTRWHVLVRQIG